jgi:hypothetical protein
MQIVLLTIGLMGLIILCMSIGVMFGRDPLKGSCGGVGGADCLCEKEGIPPKCEELKKAAARLRMEDPTARL